VKITSDEEPPMPENHVTTEDLSAVGDAGRLDASEELPPRPRRRVLAPGPLALLGVLLVACGFIAGVLVEKGQAGPPEGGAGGGVAARLSALRGNTGAAAGAGASSSTGGGFAERFAGARGGGRPTVGQVAYVDGRTLYVETAEGNTVKVTTSAGSNVTKTMASSVRAIHPVEPVVVQGSVDAGGVVAAESIGVGGMGGLGGGLGGLFGGGGRGVGGEAGGRGVGGASAAGEGASAGGERANGEGAGANGEGASGGSAKDGSSGAREEPALFGK
jgi:hypothetical protein